jgi:type III restriction enzyme
MWEASAAFHLETSPHVVSYVRNDHLELAIPYEFFGGQHVYRPDYLARLTDGSTLILEIKGLETEEDREKHVAARRWVEAVNTWGDMGRWTFEVCKDPKQIPELLRRLTS